MLYLYRVMTKSSTRVDSSLYNLMEYSLDLSKLEAN